MTASELTSREFNQDTAGAKIAAEKGPVFITNRGKRTHVLLRIEDYERHQGRPEQTLAEALAMPGYDGPDLLDEELEKIRSESIHWDHRIPDFSDEPADS